MCKCIYVYTRVYFRKFFMNNGFKLNIPIPTFDSKITSLIINLEKLREHHIQLEVDILLFLQVNIIFHMLESLQSARIEGNRTTLSEYVQAKFERSGKHENIEEIQNIENAISYINQTFGEDKNFKINKRFLFELHTLITKGLKTEGSRTPGAYRTGEVKINNAQHTPPMAIYVNEYMERLIDWINEDSQNQFALLKVAKVHHLFTWIHPFDNGNGRMSRVLTYAMLRQYGFEMAYLMNLSAIFCIDRDIYFDNLQKADSGEDEDVLYWCEYVLTGLNDEMQKMKKLMDKKFFASKIVTPAINSAFNMHFISEEEKKVLELSLNQDDNIIMGKDIAKLLKDKNTRQVNHLISKMLKASLLIKNEPKGRKYLINIINKDLVRGIINNLANEKLIDFYD